MSFQLADTKHIISLGPKPFLRYFNVTTGLVSQWKRGEKRPRGVSLKLLTLVAKHGLGAVA